MFFLIIFVAEGMRWMTFRGIMLSCGSVGSVLPGRVDGVNDAFKLQELGRIVHERKYNNGHDVKGGWPGVRDFVERVAHREVPLDGDGHGEKDGAGQSDLAVERPRSYLRK